MTSKKAGRRKKPCTAKGFRKRSAPPICVNHLDPSSLPLVLTVLEVASVLRCSRAHVYALVGQGRIPAVRLGALVRIPRTALLALVEGKELVPDRASEGKKETEAKPGKRVSENSRSSDFDWRAFLDSL